MAGLSAGGSHPLVLRQATLASGCRPRKGQCRGGEGTLFQPEGLSSLKPLGASMYGSRVPPILLGSSALAAVLPRASAAKPEAAWAPKERRDSAGSDWRSTGSRSAALPTSTNESVRARSIASVASGTLHVPDYHNPVCGSLILIVSRAARRSD